MKVLKSVVDHFGKVFKNSCSDAVMFDFNDKEHQAFNIIADNPDLDGNYLKRKLSREIYDQEPNSRTFISFLKTFEKKILKIASMAESKGSDIQKIRFALLQDYSAFMRFEMLGLQLPKVELGKKLYKKAQYYHDYRTARNVLESMVQYYVSVDQEMYKYYEEIFRKVDRICTLEHEIKLKFGDVRSLQNANGLIEEEKVSIREWCQNAESDLHKASSDYHCFYYKIRLKICEDEMFEFWCNEAIDYFENLYFKHDAFISIFKKHLFDYRTRKGDISIELIQLVKNLLDKTKKYSVSWFRSSHSLVKVFMNRGDLSEAKKIINQVMASGRIKYIPQDIRNEWKLLRMYYLLIRGHYDEVNIRQIKYSLNFKNTEKSSDNIPFLIGELIYLLKTGEVDLDKKYQHLRETITAKCKENELERGLAFCDAVQKGIKFNVSKSENTFASEYVFYEKLLEKV